MRWFSFRHLLNHLLPQLQIHATVLFPYLSCLQCPQLVGFGFEAAFGAFVVALGDLADNLTVEQHHLLNLVHPHNDNDIASRNIGELKLINAPRLYIIRSISLRFDLWLCSLYWMLCPNWKYLFESRICLCISDRI
jgi:hypothetical protein